MSELPTIDPLKVAQRAVQKLQAALVEAQTELVEAQNREAHLEILAEALRDERDEARKALSDTQEPVQDITSLPEAV